MAKRITLAQPLVDQARAAELLGVSVKTVEDWRMKGRGPRFIKLGRSVRYSVNDLEEFASAGVRSSTSSGKPGRPDGAPPTIEDVDELAGIDAPSECSICRSRHGHEIVHASE